MSEKQKGNTAGNGKGDGRRPYDKGRFDRGWEGMTVYRLKATWYGGRRGLVRTFETLDAAEAAWNEFCLDADEVTITQELRG